jgi:alpha-1,6-mannosyltransferase
MTVQAARPSPGGDRRASLRRTGRLGLTASAVSIALTFAVAVCGPSVMEPALPGRAGQPPWFVAVRPSPYLMVAMTAVALAAGTAGLALTMHAARRGWSVSPRIVLAAGIILAAALALVPPIGSSDHLSYAAYGRMVTTGHNPYTTTPAALARLGDPVARAVQDWRTSPSDYGSLATGGQALASLIGGTSVRRTVFVLSLLNAMAFAVTGLLLHWLARGDRARQLRAALLWTANPMLLQVLVAGAHVDSQAIVFGIAALAVYAVRICNGAVPASPARQALAAAGAGALIGLGFAVKVSMALAGAGLAIACVVAWRWQHSAKQQAAAGGPPRWREPAALLGGLAAGFGVTAGASVAVWGPGSLRPALRAGSYVSIGSPWRAVRSALRLATGQPVAEDVVKIAAIVLAVALLVLLLRSVRVLDPAAVPGAGHEFRPAALPAAAVFAIAFAWLLAWPYVLPWYDGLGWALLALLPWSRLDWLLLARTSALAFGYLPARGIVMPAGLGWLRTVVRTGITPVILLTVIVALVMMLWPWRQTVLRGPAEGDSAGTARARISGLPS